jgi:hypothetical protein
MPPASNLWQRRFNYLPQQCLYFLPLPQGQGSLRPTFGPVRIGLAFSATVAASIPNKKARSLSLRAFESNPVLLRQNMGVVGEGTQRACRSIAHSRESVSAASRTLRNAGGRVQLDVGRQVGGHGNGITGLFAFFQRPFIRSGVNLP